MKYTVVILINATMRFPMYSALIRTRFSVTVLICVAEINCWRLLNLQFQGSVTQKSEQRIVESERN